VRLLAASRGGGWVSAVCGGFASGCGIAYAATFVSWIVLPLGCLALAVALLCATICPRLALPFGAVAAALLLGVLRGSLAVTVSGPDTIAGNLGARPVVVIGVVRSSDPGSGSDAIIDATRVSDSDTDRAVSGGVLVSGPLIPALAPGDEVEIDASGLHPLDRRPGADSEETLEREGVDAAASSPQVFVLAAGGPSLAGVIAWAQLQLTNAVDREVPEPAAALLLGIAFGIRQTLPAGVRTTLQDAGLIHIVVVSGLKVVLLIGLVGSLGKVFEWSRRRTLLVALPLVAAYVLISGAGPAALRSALMAGAAMLAATAGRRTDPVPMLALVAAILLGVSPGLVADPGFQLSFLGTAGILLLAGPIAARLPGPRLFAEPFAVTVAAQLATLPVMAGTFGVVALGGPAANALVLPLLPVMIVTGGSGALLSALHPGLGWVLLQCTALGTAAITGVARAITAIPGSAIAVGSWPAAWSIAEVAGVLAAGAVLALSAQRRAPVAA
jgi:ComEC/Rec2-related protein